MTQEQIQNEKLITKIRRLLALATSPNENEAQQAMLKAQELMVKHGFSMTDIDVEDEKKETTELDANDWAKCPWWAPTLASIIADNFKCYTLMRRKVYNRCGVTKIVFIGLKQDAEMAKEIYNFSYMFLDGVLKQNRASYKEKGYTTSHANMFNNDYAQGFIDGLKAKFAEQVEKNGWGLILVKDKDLQEYYGKKYEGKLKSEKCDAPMAGNHLAYAAGYEKGKSFNSPKAAIEGGK